MLSRLRQLPRKKKERIQAAAFLIPFCIGVGLIGYGRWRWLHAPIREVGGRYVDKVGAVYPAEDYQQFLVWQVSLLASFMLVFVSVGVASWLIGLPFGAKESGRRWIAGPTTAPIGAGRAGAALASGKTTRAKVSLVLRSIYAACLGGATCVHVLMHAQYGGLLGILRGYGYPLGTRLFWSSLTLLDPLAVVLLFVRPRVGLALAGAIIVSDVAHNSWILHHFGRAPDLAYWAQVGFLVFLGATLTFALRGLPSNPARGST